MKPLVVLDIETTGLRKDGADQIVQFAAIKVDREQNKIIDKINEYIEPEGNYVMSIGSYMAHRIHPDFLKGKPHFKDLAQRIYDFLQGCDILTFNGSRFDLPFLTSEFRKCGITFTAEDFTCYDAYVTEARRHSNKLDGCYERYCGRTMEEAGLQAHDGLADVKATYAVFKHQNDEAPVEPEEFITDDAFFAWGEYEGEKCLVLDAGKYRGLPLEIVKVVDREYLTWMLHDTLCKKTHDIIMNVLEGNKEGVS